MRDLTRGRRPLAAMPLVVAAGYIALIPLYATVYSSLPPRSFYDSNLQREGPQLLDATHLRVALAAAIASRASTDRWTEGALTVIRDGRPVRLAQIWRIQRASLEVPQVTFLSRGRLLIEITGEASGYDATPERFGNPFDVSVVSRQPFDNTFLPDITDPNYPKDVVSSTAAGVMTAPTIGVKPPVTLLFPHNEFLLDQPLATLLTSVYHSGLGDPAYASGLWARMAYFSATAVTTLGFGDITPISGAARWAVTSEAVLGLVFAGLFLNALALSIRRGQAKSGESDASADRS